MAAAKKAATDKELEAMFEAIGDSDAGDSTTPSNADNPSAGPKQDTSTNDADEDGLLAELKHLAAAPRTSTSSRPETPRLASSVATSTRARSPAGKASELYTPTTGSGRSSEEKAAAEAEASRLHAESRTKQAQETSSWWGGFGGISAIASAAVKQAGAAVKEIQKNEEAQKWADQMRGNYGALRGLGGQLSTRALPSFTDILHTIAPPISQHERLQIHITHDLVNYPSIDPLVYETFSRVMSQVEGGDLMVIQRGSESSQRRDGYTGGLGSRNGWNDSPWWKENNTKRSLGSVKGLVEGTKLARASAEAYSAEFFAARGGVEEAAKQATEVMSESNPVRSSDIFLAVQAISHESDRHLFAAGSSSKEEKPSTDEEDLVSIALYLHDPVHSIAFSALSQPFPQKWADWIDAKTRTNDTGFVPDLPEEILDIIENDGMDPREWAAEWLEEVISLTIGVVAQRYVARRMGVGEGGIGRGKRREQMEDSGAGEAARAI